MTGTISLLDSRVSCDVSGDETDEEDESLHDGDDLHECIQSADDDFDARPGESEVNPHWHLDEHDVGVVEPEEEQDDVHTSWLAGLALASLVGARDARSWSPEVGVEAELGLEVEVEVVA